MLFIDYDELIIERVSCHKNKAFSDLASVAQQLIVLFL